MRILLVEDYEPLRTSLTQALREEGFAVDSAVDGEEGWWHIRSSEHDVIVLDLMLPKVDGLTLLRRARDNGLKAHVLILTARDTIEDRVQGLNLGADDYLIKPFAFDELLARVRALIRRRYDARNPVIHLANLRIDTNARTVRRGSELLDLTAREYALLELLALRRGQLVTRTEIWEHLYEYNSAAQSNVVDVYIGYLRRKIEPAGGPRLIHTRRGQGYVLEEEQ